MPRITPSKIDADALGSRIAVREPLNCTTRSVTNSTSVTTTGRTAVMSLTHTSRTGKVLVLADMMLQTSRYTSNMQVDAGASNIIWVRTNITIPQRQVGHAVANVEKGAAVTYTMYMASQDGDTTATFPSYTTAEITVVDL